MSLQGKFGGKPFVFLAADRKIRLGQLWRNKSILASFKGFYTEQSKIGCCIIFKNNQQGHLDALSCHRYLNNRNIKGLGKNGKAELFDSQAASFMQRQSDVLLANQSRAQNSHLHPSSALQTKPSGSEIMNIHDRSDSTRLTGKEKRDNALRKSRELHQLRQLENNDGSNMQDPAAQMKKLNDQTEKPVTASKRKHDAFMSDFEVGKVVNNDVVRQQQAELPVLSTAMESEVSTFAISVRSRTIKAPTDETFFLTLNTWTSAPVTLLNSQSMLMVSSTYIFSFAIAQN
jgi:hypothetical protein